MKKKHTNFKLSFYALYDIATAETHKYLRSPGAVFYDYCVYCTIRLYTWCVVCQSPDNIRYYVGDNGLCCSYIYSLEYSYNAVCVIRKHFDTRQNRKKKPNYIYSIDEILSDFELNINTGIYYLREFKCFNSKYFARNVRLKKITNDIYDFFEHIIDKIELVILLLIIEK